MTVPAREEPQHSTLRDYARVFFKRKWIVLFIWIVATVAAFLTLKGRELIYVSTATAIIEEVSELSNPIEDEFPKIFRVDFGAEFATWNSPMGAERVIDWIEQNNQIDELVQLWFTDTPGITREGAVRAIQASMNRFVKIEGKGPIVITATFNHPRVAQILANAYCHSFKDYYARKFENAYLMAAGVYDERIAESKLKEASAQQALTAFIETGAPMDFVSLENQMEVAKDRAQQVESSIALIRARTDRAKKEVEEFKIVLERGDPSRILQYLDASSDLYSLALTLQSTLREISDQRSRGLSDTHPLVSRRIKKRDELQTELNTQLANLLRDEKSLENASFRYASLRKELDEASTALDKAQADLDGFNKTREELAAQLAQVRQDKQKFDQQLAALQNPIKAAQGQIVFYEQKKEDARSASQARGNIEKVVILNEAQLPPRAINGSWQLQVLFVSIAGLILGLLAAFGLDMLDHSYHSSEFVERELGLPVLAAFQEEKKP